MTWHAIYYEVANREERQRTEERQETAAYLLVFKHVQVTTYYCERVRWMTSSTKFVMCKISSGLILNSYHHRGVIQK